MTEVGALPKQAFSDVCTWLSSVVDSQCSLIGDQSDEGTNAHVVKYMDLHNFTSPRVVAMELKCACKCFIRPRLLIR